MPVVTFPDGRVVDFPDKKPSKRTIPQIRAVMKKQGMKKALIDNAVQMRKDSQAAKKKK